jgi:Protein of unknown function (DUF1516)
LIHFHVTSWSLALILFIIALLLHNKGNEKSAKIVQMVLRLGYLLIIISGTLLLVNYPDGIIDGAMMGELIVKVISGLWVIAALEMILVRGAKKKTTALWWGQLVIALVIVLVLGFDRLPL